MGCLMSFEGGFFDIEERYVRLSEAGDPLEKLEAVVDWEFFRQPLAKGVEEIR